MATPTAYPNGVTVTSTTTETGFTIKGSFDATKPVTLAITVRSGSLQMGVADQDATFTPIIDSGVTHTTWTNSTAGQQDKFFITFSPIHEEIRMKGTATFALNW
jgi:hypothetical protein